MNVKQGPAQTSTGIYRLSFGKYVRTVKQKTPDTDIVRWLGGILQCQSMKSFEISNGRRILLHIHFAGHAII